MQREILAKKRITPGDDYLYIMSNSKIPGIVKIGRSKNPTERTHKLQNSQPFLVKLEEEYEGWGFLELLVHSKLNHLRVVEESASREWFSLSVSEANAIVEGTIVEYQLSCVQD